MSIRFLQSDIILLHIVDNHYCSYALCLLLPVVFNYLADTKRQSYAYGGTKDADKKIFPPLSVIVNLPIFHFLCCYVLLCAVCWVIQLPRYRRRMAGSRRYSLSLRSWDFSSSRHRNCLHHGPVTGQIRAWMTRRRGTCLGDIRH